LSVVVVVAAVAAAAAAAAVNGRWKKPYFDSTLLWATHVEDAQVSKGSSTCLSMSGMSHICL